MYDLLVHVHSVLRYFVLLVLLLAIVRSFSGWFGKKPYTALDNRLSLFGMVFCHVQLVIGLALYFQNEVVMAALGNMKEAMGDAVLRFWAVEHITTMIIGIALITFGRAKAKRLANNVSKHKFIAIFFTIGLIAILSMIPWPFSKIPGAWF